jgi:glycosyltransferase involved in cell wall biosynthesis
MKEEFGLAVLEAMAAGLTVVAPANGGPSTYVEHLRTGVLVAAEERLDDALVAASGLAADDDRRRRARATVEERYSIDSMARQLIDLYRSTEEAP